MISLRDASAAASTLFAVWFQEQYNNSAPAMEVELGPLFQTVNIGDYEGDRLTANWLGAPPPIREWIGEKQAREILDHAWTVLVKNREATVRIDLNALRDSRGNMYEPRIRNMAAYAVRHPYQRLSSLISGGAATVCYDGQYFFDTDHSEGSSGTQSNKLTGTGTSVAQVKTDFYAAKAKLTSLLDDSGEPMWVGDFKPHVWAPSTGPLMEALMTLMNESTVSFAVGSQSNNNLAGRFTATFDPKLNAANDWYMFNPGTPLKPFVRLLREPIHYVDNFSDGSHANPSVWSARIGEAGVEGRDGYDYGMWQSAVMIDN